MRLFTISVIMLMFAHFTYSQNIRVTYQEERAIPLHVILLNDSSIIAAARNEMNQTAHLIYNEQRSIYRRVPKESEIPEEILIYKPDEIFKNHSKNETILQTSIVGEPFIIEQPMDCISNWTLTNGKKEICGRKCKKAVAADNTIAWYCPSIPVKDGPECYSSLPGLILQIESQAMTITAKDIEFVTETCEKIESPSIGKKITKEELQQYKQERMNELCNQVRIGSL